MKNRWTADRVRSSGGGGLAGKIAHMAWRFIQIIMACVVIGYYASDLNAARKVNKYADSKWGYAVAVGSLSAVTALALGILGFFASYGTVAIVFAWEWILFILWAAVTGIFVSMYRHENPEMDGGIESMKTAYKFDAVNLVMWFISACLATFIFFFKSPRKSLHTGRANL